MKKSVLMSFSPYWNYLICEGIKTDELRKRIPQSKDWNGIIEMYCTKDMRSFNRIPKEFQEKYRSHMGKVNARFKCADTTKYESEFWDDTLYESIREVYEPDDFFEYGEYERYIIAENGEPNKVCENACITWDELRNYIGQGHKEFYALHIADLVIYDKPKELREFYIECKGSCVGCKHFVDHFAGYCKHWVESKHRLTRPFQSWGYVEEQNANS